MWMDKLVRGNCQKCNKTYILPIGQLGLHQDPTGLLMCTTCCKEQYWYDKKRCDMCSEKTICKGLFVKNFQNHIEKGRVEGI